MQLESLDGQIPLSIWRHVKIRYVAAGLILTLAAAALGAVTQFDHQNAWVGTVIRPFNYHDDVLLRVGDSDSDKDRWRARSFFSDGITLREALRADANIQGFSQWLCARRDVDLSSRCVLDTKRYLEDKLEFHLLPYGVIEVRLSAGSIEEGIETLGQFIFYTSNRAKEQSRVYLQTYIDSLRMPSGGAEEARMRLSLIHSLQRRLAALEAAEIHMFAVVDTVHPIPLHSLGSRNALGRAFGAGSVMLSLAFFAILYLALQSCKRAEM